MHDVFLVSCRSAQLAAVSSPEGHACAGRPPPTQDSYSYMQAAGPLTLEQVDQFEKLGYVLVDTPFDDAWIDAAQAAWARLTQAYGNQSTSKEDDQGRTSRHF